MTPSHRFSLVTDKTRFSHMIGTLIAAVVLVSYSSSQKLYYFEPTNRTSSFQLSGSDEMENYCTKNISNYCMESISVKGQLNQVYNFSGNFETETSSCLLDSPESENCKLWQVSVVIMLVNDKSSNAYLQQIQNFIYGVTAFCSFHSTMQLFAPGLVENSENCSKYQIGSLLQKNLVSHLQPSETFISDIESSGDLLYTLMQQVVNCSSSFSMEASVVYVFTDAPCIYLCRSEKLYMNIQEITSILITRKYIIKFMYLNDDGRILSCLESLFRQCKTIPESFYSVEVYGKGTESLNSCIRAMRTCPEKIGNDVNITTAELVLIISFPCLCITIICIICVMFYYKKTKMNTLLWRKFWMNQMKGEGEGEMKDLWELPRKNLFIQEDKILGNGAFSNVYKATFVGKIPFLIVNASLNFAVGNPDTEAYEVAVKRLPDYVDNQNRLDFFHEIQFMKKLGYHVHIISMLGCISDQWDPLIIIEYCEHGDLLRFLRKHKQSVLMMKSGNTMESTNILLKIKDLVKIAWQVSDGMTYLSSRNFIHRDVAARNVLLTKNLVAKISDFGLCRYIDSTLYVMKGGRLPVKWMALESLKFYEYSAKSDVWSFSVLLFEIFSLGDSPYQEIKPQEMISYLEQGNRLPQPEQCPNEM